MAYVITKSGNATTFNNIEGGVSTEIIVVYAIPYTISATGTTANIFLAGQNDSQSRLISLDQSNVTTISGVAPSSNFATFVGQIVAVMPVSAQGIQPGENLSEFTADSLKDANGNEEIIFTATASAVNELTIANAATGNAPSIAATGTDADISLNLVPKGTGRVQANAVNVVTVSSTDTLTNKTLTAPKFADGGFIADANGNELIVMDTVASAVNEVTVSNAATTAAPKIAASGETNVALLITGKGTGNVRVGDAADNTKLAEFALVGATAATKTTLTISQTADRVITFPDATTTLVGTDTTNTLTNKTLTSPVINVGSDATGDIYYRDAGGLYTRLPIGTEGQVLTVTSGIPAWVTQV